jgi:two-component system alkaline phosphatase synthesis response regulator PhoP
MSVKLLVVEDNADTRDLLHFYFTSKGFDVITANDGVEGIFKARIEHPNLVISDLNMPNGSGLQLLEEIRSTPDLVALPIVIYTAFGKNHTEEIFQAGANRVFHKPLDFVNLLQYVTTILEQSDQSEAWP